MCQVTRSSTGSTRSTSLVAIGHTLDEVDSRVVPFLQQQYSPGGVAAFDDRLGVAMDRGVGLGRRNANPTPGPTIASHGSQTGLNAPSEPMTRHSLACGEP